MVARRSLSWPIALGVTLIVLVIALLIGWIIVTVKGTNEAPYVYYTLLAVGTTLFAVVLVGVILYLLLTIKAVRLTQRQSNFIDSVTHELKSPIASLKLHLQTLEMRKLSPEQVAEVHHSMLDVLHGLNHLIDHLLDAARLDKNVLNETPLEEVDLCQIIQGCATSTCKVYDLPNETVELKLRPVEMMGRAKELEIIFRNLIDNALKYGGKEPKVEIDLYSPAPERIAIRISDNGPGIPANLRRKIFGRFVRLGNELERKQAGTGLGLYIVRELVRGMFGKVNVRSRGNQPGTTFEVELPGRLL